MRLPILIAAILAAATPLAARAQTATIGVSAHVMEREEVQRADAGVDEVRVERTRGGTRLTVPLVLTHRLRPLISVQQRAGDPSCELVRDDAARSDAGWATTLRCTAPTSPGAPVWARLVITPNT
ncbi:MAG: hypothetical protein ICV87_13870 [Gemmatimonadetes bacterium]|nr:hypothetical protein [Gemmatimonadota bacterium]